MKKYDDTKPNPKTPQPNIPPKGRKPKKENEPCPFCGNNKPLLDDYGSDGKVVVCKNCGCMTKFFDTKKEAVKAWNTRIKNNPQITEEEQEKILTHVLKQNIQISRQITLREFRGIKIECFDCGKSIGLINMYRCFQCGLYICGDCAPKHFNIDKSKLPRYIKDENNG